jgi:hypothetical protein
MIKQSLFSGMGPNGEQLINVITPGSGFVKTAGVHPEIQAFKQNLSPEPDKTYLHILALGAGEFYGSNLNNDYFPWDGLSHDHTKIPHKYVHGYKTFLNAHAFAHHQNNDPTKAYGDVLVSVLNEKMKRVELIAVVDHAKCRALGGDKILEKLIEGKDMATSMGCRIPYDTCMICGNNAPTRKEYCECMLKRAGQILPDGRKVCVTNPFPRFFDISFVYIGADRTSHVLEKIATAVDMGANTHKQAALMPMVKSFFSGMDPTGLGSSWQLKQQMDADDRQKSLNRMAHTAGGVATGLVAVPVLTSGLEKGVNTAVANPKSSISSFGSGFIRGIKHPFEAAANIVPAYKSLRRVETSSPALLDFTAKEIDSLRKVTNIDIPTHLSEASLKSVGASGQSLESVLNMVSPDFRRGLTPSEQAAAILNMASPDKLRKVGLDNQTITEISGMTKKLVGGARKVMMDKIRKAAVGATVGGVLGGLAAYNALSQKTAASRKQAVVEKLSEIFKEVDGYPLGQAVNLMEGCEQDIPDDMLDAVAQMPQLPPVLNSMARSGIVLSPREFTRIIIVRMSPGLDASPRVEPYPTDEFDSNFFSRMSDVYPDRLSFGGVEDMRSYSLPAFLSRLASPIKMASKSESVKLAMPDVSAMYNAYRYGILMNMDKYAGLENMTLSPEATPIVASLVSIPLIYMLKCHWDRQLCEDKEFLENFVENNPCISQALAAIGIKMGLDSLLSKYSSQKIMSWSI